MDRYKIDSYIKALQDINVNQQYLFDTQMIEYKLRNRQIRKQNATQVSLTFKTLNISSSCQYE